MSEEKRKNGFVSCNETSLGNLQRRILTEIRTEKGYLQILEYILQDCSHVHVVLYYFNDILEEGSNFPKLESKSFYRDKSGALDFAHLIGNELLLQYDVL